MKANRKSWKIDPISNEKVAMDIYAEYSAVEYEKMSEGFQSYDMDQKWFIYMEDDVLYFHRSWTGQCIFEARFVKAGDKYIIKKALTLKLKSEDDRKVKAYLGKMLLFLIDAILLGKNSMPPELEENRKNPAESFFDRFHLFGYSGVSPLEIAAVSQVMKEIKERKE